MGNLGCYFLFCFTTKKTGLNRTWFFQGTFVETLCSILGSLWWVDGSHRGYILLNKAELAISWHHTLYQSHSKARWRAGGPLRAFEVRNSRRLYLSNWAKAGSTTTGDRDVWHSHSMYNSLLLCFIFNTLAPPLHAQNKATSKQNEIC